MTCAVAVDAGMSCRAVADRFGVAASTAVKLMLRSRDAGSQAPRRRALAAALPRIAQSECRNYLTAAGYDAV